MLAPPRLGHAAAWGIAILAMALIYLLSVPVVTAIIQKPKRVTPHTIKTSVSVASASGWMIQRIPPPWLQAYQKPYHWLANKTPLQVVLRTYANWCWEILGEK